MFKGVRVCACASKQKLTNKRAVNSFFIYVPNLIPVYKPHPPTYKPYKLINTEPAQLGSRRCQKQLAGLAVGIVGKVQQQKQRIYVNALVPAYLVVLEQVFQKAEKGCPNKTKKTYFYSCKHNIWSKSNESSKSTYRA